MTEPRTTDWKRCRWTTNEKSHASTFAGSARIVWATNPKTDVAYICPTDGNMGNTNGALIAIAPDMARALLAAAELLSGDKRAGAVEIVALVQAMRRKLQIDEVPE